MLQDPPLRWPLTWIPGASVPPGVHGANTLVTVADGWVDVVGEVVVIVVRSVDPVAVDPGEEEQPARTISPRRGGRAGCQDRIKGKVSVHCHGHAAAVRWCRRQRDRTRCGRRSEAKGEVNELHPGDPEHIGPYRLQARIGAGGMGVVYLASEASGREVALKLIREELAADHGFRARFAREVRAGQRVGGMCTAHYLDADLDSPRPYLVSEYVAGGNLADYVGEHGPLEGDRLMGLAVGLAEGLVAMGAAGVIHRDLKPTNVLMGERGPKIIDFGISDAADGTSLTQTGAVVGSPSWMAPEQARGRDATAAVDVFSWGATVAFAATGRQPFGEGRPDAVIYRVVHEEPDLTGVDARVLPLVRSALGQGPGAPAQPRRPARRRGEVGHPGRRGAT